MPSSIVRRYAIATACIATVGVVGSLIAFVPIWPLALLEHFRLQYVVVGAVVGAALGALRVYGWFDAAALATLLNLCTVAPDLSASAQPLPSAGTPLRVLVLNVHTSSHAFAEVRELIAATHPDIVGLVEVDQRWLDALAPAVTSYAQRIEHPRDDNFGVAFYSRLPMTGAIEELGSRLPSVVTTVDLQGTPVAVVLTHPLPPVRSALFDELDVQLAAVAARARELGPHVLVMGDFNATPWSRPLRHFVAASGLCDTRAGFGVQASFPASSFVLRIPIDHVFASCSIGVRERRIERDVGSDHLPVVVDVVVPR